MNIQQLREEWLKLSTKKKRLLRPIFIRRAKLLQMGSKQIKLAKKIFGGEKK